MDHRKSAKIGHSTKVLARKFHLLRNGTSIALTFSSFYDGPSIKEVAGSRARGSETMVTVKSSQKIFTDSEVATLTGICVDHVHNFAKSRHLGFIARAAEAAGLQADQWLFTLSDLMVLVTLFPKCSH